MPNETAGLTVHFAGDGIITPSRTANTCAVIYTPEIYNLTIQRDKGYVDGRTWLSSLYEQQHRVIALEYWIEFQKFEYANEVLIVAGGLLLLVGVVKIVRSSIKMLFWVLLSALGLASVSYAMDQKGISWPGSRAADLTELVEPGKEMSLDVLQVLCNKLPGFGSNDEATTE